MKVQGLFEILLAAAEKLRVGYIASLGVGNTDNSLEIKGFFSQLPEVVSTIYGKVEGTKFNPESQVFFDFIPGYRLVHANEIVDKIKIFSIDGYVRIPLFENYSSDYVLFQYNVKGESDGVYKADHDSADLELICSNDLSYFQMLVSFYEEGVYFVDQDGFLDYDFEKEGIVGRRMNSDIQYWG